MSQQGGREGEPDVEGRTTASLLEAFLKVVGYFLYL